MAESTKVFSESEERQLRATDTEIILDSGGKKIERVANVKRPKKSATIARVFKYAKKHWYLFVLSLFFGFANTIFEIAIPLIIGRGIDYIVGPGNVDFDMLLKYIVALVVCIILFAVLKWLTNKTANDLSYKMEEQMNNDLFKKFNKVPLKIIDNSSHGDLQSRMVNDIENITDGFVTGLTTFFDCFSTIAMTIVFMFLINVPIAAVIVCVTPISLLVSLYIARRTNRLFKRQVKELGDLSGTLAEYVGNQKIVKAFEYEGRSIDKFEAINKKLQDSSNKSMFYSSLTSPTSRFLNGLLYAVVAIMGCFYAMDGILSVGSISTLLSYASRYTRPFNAITEVVFGYSSGIRIGGKNVCSFGHSRRNQRRQPSSIEALYWNG